MGDFLSSAAFRFNSSSLRRPPAQLERRQMAAASSTTEQPRGALGNHGIQKSNLKTRQPEPQQGPESERRLSLSKSK